MKDNLKAIIIVIIAIIISAGTTVAAMIVTSADKITLESDKTSRLM